MINAGLQFGSNGVRYSVHKIDKHLFYHIILNDLTFKGIDTTGTVGIFHMYCMSCKKKASVPVYSDSKSKAAETDDWIINCRLC